MKKRKIKVGTLTFHMAHNYGAMLQAYALPIVVRKLGVDCEVIDYRFPYIDKWSRIERMGDLIANHGVVGGVLRYGKRAITGYYRKDTMHVRFDRFERKVIPCSKKVYRNRSELNSTPYDVILFGSDQIWNSAITNGIAEEYIGGFKDCSYLKKISYAASCGTSDFQEESKEIYDNLLRDFFAISVREEGFKDALVARGFEVECVLDPTLLLTAEEWSELILYKMSDKFQKYLLLYAFEEDERLYDVVREYAHKHHLEIIAIAYKEKTSMHGMKVLTECGPIEFLSLFYGAEHVITTSFHGTVFSIIFHKSFHCVPHPQYRERTDSLLGMLGMENHNVDDLRKLQENVTDWSCVDAILKEKRNISIEFLQRTLLDG